MVITVDNKRLVVLGRAADIIALVAVYAERINLIHQGRVEFHLGPGGKIESSVHENFLPIDK